MRRWERIAYPLARALLTVWFSFLLLVALGVIKPDEMAVFMALR
jgi:hypothetical protein